MNTHDSMAEPVKSIGTARLASPRKTERVIELPMPKQSELMEAYEDFTTIASYLNNYSQFSGASFFSETGKVQYLKKLQRGKDRLSKMISQLATTVSLGKRG